MQTVLVMEYDGMVVGELKVENKISFYFSYAIPYSFLRFLIIFKY